MRIGAFFRDPIEPAPPLKKLRALCAKHGSTLSLVSDEKDPTSPYDMMIAFGGDGTVLRALERYPDCPVLAVNYGTVGFLTQCEREELLPTMERIFSGNYGVEERLTLSVTTPGWTERAVNEVVIRGETHMIEVEVTVNGQLMSRPRGDGLIVGTPTGSTAYLLSTGAPIVTPEVDCILVNPLNEYSFSSRPVIVPGTAEVTLSVITTRPTPVTASVDGRAPRTLVEPLTLTIERAARPAKLITFNADYFFRNLKERLRW